MKGIVRIFLACLLVLFAVASCAKQPAQEINAAKSAVDAAMAEGAEKYAPADAKKVNDALNAAMDEVRGQDGKLIKDYKKAGTMLAAVKTEADTLKAGLAAKKEEAKKKAITAEESARTAVEAVKASYTKLMKSKKPEENTKALDADVKGLDDSLAEVGKLMATEDYITAIEKAGSLRERATAVSEEAKATAAAKEIKPRQEKSKKR